MDEPQVPLTQIRHAVIVPEFIHPEVLKRILTEPPFSDIELPPIVRMAAPFWMFAEVADSNCKSMPPPAKMDAIIDTTPVWKPVLEALKNLAPGGRLVINAIRKEEADKEQLLKLDYPSQLWMEKEIKSVANVARSDVADFLKLASQIPIKPAVEEYTFNDANKALMELKHRRIRGAKVLAILGSVSPNSSNNYSTATHDNSLTRQGFEY